MLDGLLRLGLGRLSAQALAEFVSVVLRKLDPALTPAEAYEQVGGLVVD